MKMELSRRRLLFGLGLAIAAALLLLAAVAGVYLYQYRQAADYPGALLISDHAMYRAAPRLYVRRDTAYRTTDAFPIVYNWYSNGFNLGPEARAHSSCILMQASTSWLALERHMSVTLCDTPTGRMIFVQRSISLRYRR